MLALVPNMECFCGTGLTVTARGTPAHAHAGGGLGTAEQGRYPRTPATPPAAGAVPCDRVFSIYYSIYCSRCCWPGVGGGLWSNKGREGSAWWGAKLPLGYWGGAQRPPPWDQWVPMVPVPCAVGSLGRGEHGRRDRRTRNTTTQRKPLLGTLQPLSRTWHFLHLPPALGPRHARGGPKTQLRYHYLYTYTYIRERGWVRSRVTYGTKSQGERCSAWRAVTPHSKHHG